MTPCCENTVTPKMIKNGEMKIGDKILFEDEIPDVKHVSAEAEVYDTAQTAQAVHTSQTAQTSQTSQAAQAAQAVRAVQENANDNTEYNSENITENKQKSFDVQATHQTESRLVSGRALAPDTASNTSKNNQSINIPLTYKEMTPYMELTSVTDINNSPMLTVPPSPMATDNYTEAIDITDVQAFTGFLRTQIGRYMRIEQLIGSGTIEERYGFLVGIGTNFIILQDIIAGNIMLIDLFTIKLTYIYYSEPVLPRGTI